MQLYGFKYSHQTLIIFKQLNLVYNSIKQVNILYLF